MNRKFGIVEKMKINALYLNLFRQNSYHRRLKIFCILFIVCGTFIEIRSQTRAVWVRPFIGAETETRKDAGKGREFIRQELIKIKRADLNTVYLEVFWDGYTIYPSRISPQRPLKINYGTAKKGGKNWDVLRAYLDEAAKLNIKIHAWIHVFHQWNTNLGGLENSPIFSKHKDWAILDSSVSPFVKAEAEGANRDIYKVFLSPSNKQARKYLRDVVQEIVTNYPDLGGIQWDYIRYPLQTESAAFDYNPQTLTQFKKETGIDARQISAKNDPKEWRAWQDWKTRQVTEVVRELGAIVRQKQPKWEISAAVFPDIEENLRVKQQDWKSWAEKGYVDSLLPMLYSTDYAKVERWAKDFRRDVAAKTRVYPAIFIGHFYEAKTGKYDERYLQLKKKYEFDGFGLFAAQSLTGDLIEKLSGEN
jgi:uncharacterized lipoprotein YddW (UPF0748 family)